jgi:hypothetical protein
MAVDGPVLALEAIALDFVEQLAAGENTFRFPRRL